MEIKRMKTITYAAMLLAGLCLMRAFAVQASEREADVEEVYSASTDGEASDEDSRSSAYERTDVRLSRPEEAAARKVTEPNDPEYALVDGAERLRNMPAGAIQVPVVATTGVRASGMAEPDLMQPRRVGASGNDTASLARQPASVPPRPASASAAEARATVLTPSSSGLARLEAQSPIPVRENFRQIADNTSGSSGIGSSREPVNARGATVSAERLRGLQEISVIASEIGFFPSRLFVTQGIPVKIYLSTPGKNTLCFMVDGFNVKKGITPGHVEEVSFVPEHTGDYRFYCPVKAIEGKLTVRAPASSVE